MHVLLDNEQQRAPRTPPFLNTHTTGGYLGELLTSLQGSELARLLQLVEGVASSLSSHHHTLTTQTTSQDNQLKLDTLKGPTVNTNTLYVLPRSPANLCYTFTYTYTQTSAACRTFWQHCGPALLSRSRDPLPSIHLPSSSAALTIFTCEW